MYLILVVNKNISYLYFYSELFFQYYKSNKLYTLVNLLLFYCIYVGRTLLYKTTTYFKYDISCKMLCHDDTNTSSKLSCSIGFFVWIWHFKISNEQRLLFGIGFIKHKFISYFKTDKIFKKQSSYSKIKLQCFVIYNNRK